MQKLHVILVQNALQNAYLVFTMMENKELSKDAPISLEQTIGAFREDVRVLGEGTPDGELDYVVSNLSSVEFEDKVLTSALKKLNERKDALKEKPKEKKEKFEGNASSKPENF